MKLPGIWYNCYRFIKRSSIAILAMGFITTTLLGFVKPGNAQGILSQPVSITLKDQRLKDAFDQLQKQTHIIFLYSDMDQLDRKVNIQVTNEPLQKVLDQLLLPAGLGYEFTGGKILISKGQSKPPKKIKLSGRVVDQEHEPLPGVSVKIKGTQMATITNADGRFNLSVDEEKETLIFSYIGFITKELQVKAGDALNIIMEANHNSLDEVVVVGYGTEKRSDLTGSVSSIKGEELQKTKAASFLEKMQGRVAGVQITSSSGEPGASVNVNIRGANSVNASSSPLYVIDGVQMDASNSELASTSSYYNPLASINAADIESIDVLKDASATAIYGSRGANGVIIITTKGGGEGSNLELNTSWGIASPSKKMSLLNGQEYADYRFFRDPTSDSWGEGVDSARQVKDFSNADSHDWQDEVLRQALTQDYNLLYSGGNLKTKFAVSMGYFNQQGILDKNKYERYSVNLKVDHTVSEKFKIGTSVNGSYGLGSGVASSNGSTGNLFGVIQNLLMFKPLYLPGQSYDELDPEALSVSNPRVFVDDSYRETPLTKVILNAYGEYNFTKDLALRSSISGVITDSENGEFYPSTTSWGAAVNGQADLNTANTLSWLQTNTLTYKKAFNGGHSIDAMLGFETNSFVSKRFDMQGEGFDIQSINPVDNISEAKVLSEKPTTSKAKSNQVSEFARLNYNYNGKYFATATLRRDGSSKIGANNQYAWFPSGALAWTISKEGFMENQHLFSNLKVRASYGITGNDRIPPYQSLANGDVVFYESPENTNDLGLAFISIANPNLKWETTAQYDAGLDFELLKGRISFTGDVYKKETRDMLLYADIPSQTGFNKQYQNIGRVDNKGLELAVNTNNINTKNFSWSTGFNIAFNRNKVISLGGSGEIPVTASGHIETVGRVIEGQPLGTGYGYVYDGTYQLNDFVDPNSAPYVLKDGVAKRAGLSVIPGDFKFKDLNGDHIIDSKDQTVISNSNPQHFGGLTNTFTYKNFDLSVLLQWSYGNQILNAGRYRYEGYQTNNLSTDFWYNRWTPENPTNAYPALFANGRYDASTYYVEDGSYLRLKNITLGYHLPASMLKKLHVKNWKFYVTGDNLITWTKYSGFDPEVVSKYDLMPGLDMISYPRARTYTLGMNIQF